MKLRVRSLFVKQKMQVRESEAVRKWLIWRITKLASIVTHLDIGILRIHLQGTMVLLE